MKLDLFDEFSKYDYQYTFAIFRLLDQNPNIMDMILPLTNLIHQKIENEIKMYISEPHINEQTFKELKIDNTHKIRQLLEREELKKYYDDINICEKYYKKYKKNVLYFYEILGEDSFLNSRYPIEINQNTITIKKAVDLDELYKNWTEYCEIAEKLTFMYIAYGSSNYIIYLKKENQIHNEQEEDIYIKKIIEESFMQLEYINLEDEKYEIFKLIKEYVKRDKYFDMSYVR